MNHTLDIDKQLEYPWAAKKVPAVDRKTGEGLLVGATYQPLPCGCRVIGNGTLPHPLTIKQCALHAAAHDLLAACKEALHYVSDEGGTAEPLCHELLEQAIGTAEGREAR